MKSEFLQKSVQRATANPINFQYVTYFAGTAAFTKIRIFALTPFIHWGKNQNSL
jgi:hypothetical protein